jgi:mono/diheme cytochrome c family protein
MSQTYNHSVWCAAAATQTHLQRRRHFALVTGLLLAVGIATLTISDHVAATETMTPLERVFSTPKGQLKSPYPDVAEVADEGYEIYKSLDCGGCHGGGGGGGMAAPLTNPVWIYGDEDDTLFRLITLGTGSLSFDGAFPKQGFVRTGSEAVVGPMPPYGEIIKSEDDLWKIIAWIRSVNPQPRR